ncbi:hypothetical protein HKX54_16230 [Sulfitobacter sp. M57]|nr:hypothetical protein [Sulfitobacter sp. KE5]MDF3423497.1 hypothetical protein [Sulfitobacter sp. KE43]MDF3434563.1 hypothetical protein [Sulfitobacter sp. KE42]MDF3460203.1 hypothetical protein [Sulfitobacter sp. S74]MDF3464101.1 hypothetical protein [Sulfitobacter sp. Ks18]MDF3468191.1 hypothetical protein [Sulfitobacter sp. M05]MDF3471896.1 hypothetical protein [Sulfitobacter sp. M28]MDF3475645.1 hypothetical protein [Sulfitobacter sp. M48]MDF3479548.1 hypothetical protein [Sulfitobact
MAAEIDRFEGTFTGQAEFTVNGAAQKRDMSTTIKAQNDGFVLSWTSVTFRSDGRTKEATYTIQFVPSARDNIFQSAMKKNLFGKATPLDPLQGEPFVWARFEGDMFSVFSLFINETGDYEVQEFHRSLAEGGLDLLFRRFRNGTLDREIKTLLLRQD